MRAEWVVLFQLLETRAFGGLPSSLNYLSQLQRYAGQLGGYVDTWEEPDGMTSLRRWRELQQRKAEAMEPQPAGVAGQPAAVEAHVPEESVLAGGLLEADGLEGGVLAVEDVPGQRMFSAPGLSDLEPVAALRDRLAIAVLGVDRQQGRRELNALAREFGLHPALDGTSSVYFVAASTGFPAELSARLIPAAMDLHSTGLIDRIRDCLAPGCGTAFLDTSKQDHRQYCSQTCASRIRMRRARQRKASA